MNVAAPKRKSDPESPATESPPSPYPSSKKLDERWMSECEAVIDIISAFFNISGKELRSPTRSPAPVARVRQIGMYCAHTILQIPMKNVGCGFARDRTTVQHAINLVEDWREDREFDGIVDQVERLVRVLVRREPI